MKMGYHLVGKRDLGLRPLAGAQGHVAARDLRVGALARGHGAAGLCNTKRCGLPISSPAAQPMRSVGVALQPLNGLILTAPQLRTIADARGQSLL